MALLLSGLRPVTNPPRPLWTGSLRLLAFGVAREERRRSCSPSSISRVSVVRCCAAIAFAVASSESLMSRVVFMNLQYRFLYTVSICGLVEFDDEVWVMDYKLGDSEDAARYRAQMQKYKTAMQSVYAGKQGCALCVGVCGWGIERDVENR